jgi:two-component system, LytTR family, response regulator
MIKVLIIEDEPLAAGLLKEMLQAYPGFELLGVCHNGFEGMKAIKELTPDLIFLDVQMPKLSGFEMLELLEDPPPVIFCTAFDQYALQAFEVHSIDYLLKPYSKDRFRRAIEKFLRQQSGAQQISPAPVFSTPDHANRIVVKVNHEVRFIPFDELMYLEANDDFVNIYSKDQRYIKNRTLSHFEQQLPGNDFLRVHRSYILRIDQIRKIELYGKDSYVAILKNGVSVPVSKAGYQKLKLVMGL